MRVIHIIKKVIENWTPGRENERSMRKLSPNFNGGLKNLLMGSLLFFTFTLFVVSDVFALGITSVKITNVQPSRRIPCGGKATVTVRIGFVCRPFEPLPQTGTLELYEWDWGFWDEDELISDASFTINAGDPSPKIVWVEVMCDEQNANQKCDFYGNKGKDDEHGAHVLYGWVKGKGQGTSWNTDTVYCVKPDGSIAMRIPDLITPGGEVPVYVAFVDSVSGLSTIDIYVCHDSNCFSVPAADFDSTYYELFDTLNVDFDIPGAVHFYAQTSDSLEVPPDLGWMTFSSSPSTPFGEYLVDTDSSSFFLDYLNNPMEIQLGSENIVIVPPDTLPPTIDTTLIYYCDSLVGGYPGAITDEFDSLPGYLEVNLLLEDSLDIGYVLVNADGSFLMDDLYLIYGDSLKFLAIDGVGNTTTWLFTAYIVCVDPNDHGICDTLYKEVWPGDQIFDYPGPDFARVPLHVTHDVPDPLVDSIAGFTIPLCFTHTNTSKYCSLSAYWNNTDLYPYPTIDRSIFRHLDGETNWMMALSERMDGSDWDTRILTLDGTSHFWLSMFPTGQQDQRFEEGSRVLLATMTFKLEDTMTICIDTCFSPPNARLAFTRSDGETYIPRHFFPQCEVITPLICGDCKPDGILDLGDLLWLISYLYKGGPAPNPLCIGDVNCDSLVDLGDVLHVIGYLYKGGSAPCPECCYGKLKMGAFPGQKIERDLLRQRPLPPESPSGSSKFEVE